MRLYFEPRRDPNPNPGWTDGGSAEGLSDLPAGLLHRHGARILDPAAAPLIHRGPVPRSTVYRAKTLLVPGDVLDNRASLNRLNVVLARTGMRLIPLGAKGSSDRGQFTGVSRKLAAKLARLPRTAVLVPLENRKSAATVDAWLALQTLRAAASGGGYRRLATEAVSRISLEHLLAGAALGSPASDGYGISGSPASQGHGISGPGSTDSYLFGGFDARIPVALCLSAPPRHSQANCKARFGRRPVIMTLDTGVLAHPWLDVRAVPSQAGQYRTAPDGFVSVDCRMQNVIMQDSEQAASAGDRPRQVLDGPWDRPFTGEALMRELATDIGHGVFIAGIVRQVVPDAQVLSVRIMHSDGIVYEGDLICALRLLVDRVAAATADGGDMTQMVDVLSLSFGYFSETRADEIYTSGLWEVLDTLLGMGVAVTASAGNYATNRRCYPAAFSDRTPTQNPAAPLISVGALNPNGSKAAFSDDGSWVRAWATGAAMVSTFPGELNGSREPQIRSLALPANQALAGQAVRGDREALDPDDYSDGFAVWSGTSFSAPLVAAALARALIKGAADQGLRLDQDGTGAAVLRIRNALRDPDWQG
jgi:hypothetical protein